MALPVAVFPADVQMSFCPELFTRFRPTRRCLPLQAVAIAGCLFKGFLALWPSKGGGKSQYPIFGSTTGRIAALLLACVASDTALRAPCTASRQRTQKRHMGYFRLPNYRP